MAYQNIIAEKKGAVGLITLHRPDAMNALNQALINELFQAVEEFEADDDIGALVLTGSEKAFAAGADIKEMQSKGFVDCYLENFITKNWERVAVCRKPVIAAVAGYALGGGCELAMMCDFIIAASNAKFGQPEITIGAMPGAGGTQRLTRLVGKAKAMDMCLTGRMMDAGEAERAGLVSRIVDHPENLLEEALKAADGMAKFSRLSTYMVKEAINRAQETSLSEGILFERRMFHTIFGTEDQKEGMAAFTEKRQPKFTNK